MRAGGGRELADLHRGHPANPQPERQRPADDLRRRQPAQRDPRKADDATRLRQTVGSDGEAGFTIIEVLVAALVLALAALATFGVLASATRNAQRAKATQVAIDRAQEEIEKLHSLSFEQLAMTTTPSYATSTLDPNHRVINGSFALQREPPSEYATMVVNGGPLYGETEKFVEGGVVTPGPIPFESGDVTGKLYRYVVWRNDTQCPESETVEEDLCPGEQDYKQIVVAVKLDTPATSRPSGATSKCSRRWSTRTRDRKPPPGRRRRRR